MKNLSCNSVIVDGVFCGPEIEEGTFHNEVVDGVFCGPEIEEGTFHHFDVDSLNLNLHRKDIKKCPCPPVELPRDDAPKVSGKDEKNLRNNKS